MRHTSKMFYCRWSPDPPKRIKFIHAHLIEVRPEDNPDLPPPPPGATDVEGDKGAVTRGRSSSFGEGVTPMTGMFAVERFIEGQYLKHNNNSGFIENDQHRMTPQAFSHFTHTASSGGEMVVDVQGVGDLWTDPQIHSDKLRYGSGDLGDRGMALFFATHQCNGVCQYMGLEPFPLAPSQCKRINEKVVSPNSVALEEKVGTVMEKQGLGSLAEAKNETMIRGLPLRRKAAPNETASNGQSKSRPIKMANGAGRRTSVPDIPVSPKLLLGKHGKSKSLKDVLQRKGSIELDGPKDMPPFLSLDGEEGGEGESGNNSDSDEDEGDDVVAEYKAAAEDCGEMAPPSTSTDPNSEILDLGPPGTPLGMVNQVHSERSSEVTRARER
mmetsp:Transcript_27232/g.73601  ORF Transcript_27232/g.73601 Transcript_27232/m.73601 type:complete len:383 (+) Transcript_27232:961-2109(+)